VRIEGNHEIVELVPGGRSVDPDHGFDFGSSFDPGRDDVGTDAGPAPSRFGEWWTSGRPAAWRARGRERIAHSRPVRPIVDAVSTAVARVPPHAKVVLALLVIAAAGFAALGVAGAVVLRDYVNDRADAQLHETTDEIGAGPSWLMAPGFGRSTDPERRSMYFFARPMPAGVAAQLRSPGGFIREFGVTSWSGAEGPLIPADFSARAGRPFTAPARATADRWRVLVTTPTEGTTLIVAVNFTSADAAIGRLTQVALVAGALVLALMAFVGLRAVRSSTPQLSEIERTLEAAVAGDLSRRVPVPAKAAEPGQVAHAVNTLIEQIGDAREAEKRALRRVGEADRAARLPLSVIQGFTAYYRDVHRQEGRGAEPRPGHDPVRMARLVDRVGDEAARIGVVLQDLVADLSHAANENANGFANGNGSAIGYGAVAGNGVGPRNGAMHRVDGQDRNGAAGRSV
jgi:two-component system OmpR family sensor kinase